MGFDDHDVREALAILEELCVDGRGVDFDHIVNSDGLHVLAGARLVKYVIWEITSEIERGTIFRQTGKAPLHAPDIAHFAARACAPPQDGA